ncbi:hypothetical protein [Streptomyces sp. NBC_01483]|uniref:hypothetical protein n=1 Tax=Streptomyces sp. NBC_01483 TaxID=2903883 RepID=UPI002E37F495|nr:hypothetical protein [Streptomyces sp. NBC_01483]
MDDLFARLRRAGELKLHRLGGEPSDRRLARIAGVSPGTPGAWLDGRQLPQRIDPLLAVLGEIRAEAARRGLLTAQVDSPGDGSVAELLYGASDASRVTQEAESQQQGDWLESQDPRAKTLSAPRLRVLR